MIESPQTHSRLHRWLTEKIPQIADGVTDRLSRPQLMVLLICLGLLARPLVSAYPNVWQQGVIAVLLIATGYTVLRLEETNVEQGRHQERLHLFMVILSGLTTLRYFYYRTRYTINFETPLDTVFSLLLYFAELYAIGTLFLSYFQTLQLKHRQPVALALAPEAEWPTVDVYIPTYDEEVEIVRKTVLAAVAMDYPQAKKTVYLLDDGRKDLDRRVQLQDMCNDLGPCCSPATTTTMPKRATLTPPWNARGRPGPHFRL
jgi:cellulose synthase (UDP-forming)